MLVALVVDGGTLTLGGDFPPTDVVVIATGGTLLGGGTLEGGGVVVTAAAGECTVVVSLPSSEITLPTLEMNLGSKGRSS